MEGRDSPGPFSESFCVPVAICGQKGLLTLGRKCRTWAREAGSTLAGCGGKAARRTDWPVGVGCMERAQLRTGRPKVAREVAEHSMDSKKRRFRHIYFIRRQRQRGSEKLAIAVLLARQGEGFRAGSFCVAYRTGQTSRYLADRYSQYSHRIENGAAAAPHDSAVGRGVFCPSSGTLSRM